MFKNGFIRLNVVKSGVMWLKMVKCGYYWSMWSYVVIWMPPHLTFFLHKVSYIVMMA